MAVISAGRALIRRVVLDAPQGEASLSSRFVVAQKANRLAGVLLDADWLHVGDPAAIVEAQARLAGRWTELSRLAGR
ncbi:MAG: hypothetical protein WD017_08180 [Cucumibacter sp.]